METTDVIGEEKATLATLTGDILQDAHKLVEKQVQLTKLQLFEDWGAFKPFALWLAFGLVTLSSAGLLFSLTVVFLLHEQTQWPLAACFAVSVLLFLIVGVGALMVARTKSRDLSFVNE